MFEAGRRNEVALAVMATATASRPGGKTLALGGAQGDRHRHHDGDIEVDQRAEHSSEGQDGRGGRDHGTAAGDQRAGQDPEHADAPGQRGRHDDRGQGRERPDGGPCRGGRPVRPQRSGEGREDAARRPHGDPYGITR